MKLYITAKSQEQEKKKNRTILTRYWSTLYSYDKYVKPLVSDPKGAKEKIVKEQEEKNERQ